MLIVTKNVNWFQINKVITGVSYFTHRHTVTEEEEWLTAERMAVSKGSTSQVSLPFE